MRPLSRRSLFALPLAVPAVAAAAVVEPDTVRRPIAIGNLFNIEPMPVDPGRLVFAVNDGPVHTIPAVRDGGVLLLWADDFETAERLAAADIPLGGYSTCLKAGLFRLAAPPVFRVTADVLAGGPLGAGFYIARPYADHELAGVALDVRYRPRR